MEVSQSLNYWARCRGQGLLSGLEDGWTEESDRRALKETLKRDLSPATRAYIKEVLERDRQKRELDKWVG